MQYLSTLSLMYSGWYFPIHIDKMSHKKNYASIENLKYLKYIYLLYIKKLYHTYNTKYNRSHLHL